MLEKRFIAVPPQLFTADGTVNGTLKVVYSGFFKVKQQIVIQATSLPNLELEVKRIIDVNTIEVGPKGPINNRQDISAYTVAAGAFIFANEQNRPSIPFEETTRAVYEEEPTVAYRVIGVGRTGNSINWEQDGVTPTEWDDVQLAYDIDQFVTDVQFYLRGEEITHLQLTYDINHRLIRARKV